MMPAHDNGAYVNLGNDGGMTAIQAADVSDYLTEKGISHSIVISVSENRSPRVFRRIDLNFLSADQERMLDLALGLKGCGCELVFSAHSGLIVMADDHAR